MAARVDDRARVRLAVRITGVVQGVGFRPFVYTLSRRLGLTGHVGNDSQGVFVEVEGDRKTADEFLRAVRAEAPPLAVVESVVAREIAVAGSSGFEILASRADQKPSALVSADTATCGDCLREMWDPVDRRYRYPFVNCTNCGPRFTIVRGVPYDRPQTTMADFVMCSDCAREYSDTADRRFHAQPVCCPRCGPRLTLLDASGVVAGDPLDAAVARLLGGEVLAVKGLGGYHLAADARDEDAVRALRQRKHREEKPFAVMVPDLAAAARLCVLDDPAEGFLADHRRPIVLLPRRPEAPVAKAVAPGNRQLGLMLPYTPLHHLLLADFGRPLVMTSGNVSDEPIVYRDDEAWDRLATVADTMLTHDRPIHVRTDDSVVRPQRDRAQLVRRSRGFVPTPITLAHPVRVPVLACGAQLKNTFCLARHTRAFVSHHIGDLENYETLRSFTEGVRHFRRVFDIAPQVVAHDLHPDYLSTAFARDLADDEGLALEGVQHHHAHIASCLADNGERGPVIGVAFDGTGYGEDGTIWGGEFLLADLTGSRRAGHLSRMRLPGGATAIRQPWRMAVAALDAAGLLDEASRSGGPLVTRHSEAWSDVVAVARAGAGSPWTSSAGRLFDAVAALLDVRDAVSYEGQAAIELEQLADPTERGSYRVPIGDADPVVVGTTELVRACVAERRAGVPRATVAARFHNAVADAVVATCRALSSATGLRTVALSGGVFANQMLTTRVIRGLVGAGLTVLTHAQVPCNDGGISLGQTVVAGARAIARESSPRHRL
jgi:hydrogenase maturation protein HypF